MKKILIYGSSFILLIIVVLAMFSGKPDYEIHYAVNEKLCITDGEKILDRNQDILNKFEVCCSTEGVELMLNKAFKFERPAYISLNVDATPQKVVQEMQNDPLIEVLGNREFAERNRYFWLIKFKRRDHFVLRAIFSEVTHETTIVYDEVLPDLESLDKLFNTKNYIGPRLTCPYDY